MCPIINIFNGWLARVDIYVVYHYSRAKRASAEVVYNVSGIQRILTRVVDIVDQVMGLI